MSTHFGGHLTVVPNLAINENRNIYGSLFGVVSTTPNDARVRSSKGTACNRSIISSASVASASDFLSRASNAGRFSDISAIDTSGEHFSTLFRVETILNCTVAPRRAACASVLGRLIPPALGARNLTNGSGHSTGLNAATGQRQFVDLVPTLDTDLPSNLENWPFTKLTPVDQHAHVDSAVTGGSEVGAGSFSHERILRNSGLADRKYMPMRGASLSVVPR